MKIRRLQIPEVVLLEPVVYGDERGYFMETWRDGDFRKDIADVTFVQENESRSHQRILRGLHYQIESPQGKLVRVHSGTIYDVAVDLRKNSPTFGQWVGCELTSERKQILWIPPGFAHGFYVISEFAEFIYKCTDYYAPEYERTIAWDDRELNIDWPIQKGHEPVLSEKDSSGVGFNEAEVYL